MVSLISVILAADTALRLAMFFGTTPQFWLGLQNDYDLEESKGAISDVLKNIHPMTQPPLENQVQNLSL